jgi:hypothetical protein
MEIIGDKGWTGTNTDAESLDVGAWNDLPFTRFDPPEDWTDVLLEMYLYLRVRVRPNYFGGVVQTQVMREGTNPPDPATPNNEPIIRKAQTIDRMTTISPEFGWPFRSVTVMACKPGQPLTWQIYVGPEFSVPYRQTLYAKAYRQIRPYKLV